MDQVHLLELIPEQTKDDLPTLYMGYCRAEFVGVLMGIISHINTKLAVINNNEFRTHVLTLPQ
jgi:hypothetical protein